jgi:imidazole glycerol-phosphate synthase subunit HisH
VALADYGSGNTRSVAGALWRIGAEVDLVPSPDHLPTAAKALVLPGVGAFRSCVHKLRLSGWSAYLQGDRATAEGFPVAVLGICVGFQVLARQGTEGGAVPGLGIIEGDVDSFGGSVPAKHVGWDETRFTAPFLGFTDGDLVDFYYDHAYAYPRSTVGCAAISGVGNEICVAAQVDRVWGVQFHPERSGDAGLAVLSGFLRESYG